MDVMKDYILWLPSWYPNQLTPYDGDFIQRHARAAALYRPIKVVHVIRDPLGIVTKNIKIEERIEGQLHEIIVYYYIKKSLLPKLDKWRSFIKYRRLYSKVIENLVNQHGKPSLQHVHISFKAGLAALDFFQKEKIPFVLTEQWTVYLKEAKPNISDLPFYQKHIIHKIINCAAAILPVSEYLAQSMKTKWPKKRYEVIPNVVDLNIFKPNKSEQGKKLRLIHISNLSYQKNPELLFHGLKLLSDKGIQWNLDIIGAYSFELVQFCKKLGILSMIHFHGELPQNKIVSFLQRCNASILVSRYETFGCVIIESFACGIPVIVADTPLMKEIVADEITGYRIAKNDPFALAEALLKLNNNKHHFKENQILEEANKYSFKNIGKLLNKIYLEFSVKREIN